MTDEAIIIKIVDGKLNIEAVGYQGSGCDDATKFLEDLGKLEKVTKKKEYRREAGQRTGRRIAQ